MELIERLPADSGAKATPLLFVHGAWHAAWCWDEFFMPYFAGLGYACYAPSLRGHGASPGRDRLRWTRISEYVDDIADVASRLPAQPVLIGHSAGGFAVQKFLERRAAAGAILIASVPPTGAARTTLRVARKYPRKFLEVQLRLSLAPLIDTRERARELFFSASMPADQVAGYHERLQDESYRAFLDLVVFDLVKPKKVRRVPMLVLGGADDALFTPRQVRRTAETFGADFEIFQGMAHDLMLEPAWTDVAERMAGWLDTRFPS
jgi:pimeloyl-ACP methyl ester carboxylesterase